MIGKASLKSAGTPTSKPILQGKIAALPGRRKGLDEKRQNPDVSCLTAKTGGNQTGFPRYAEE